MADTLLALARKALRQPEGEKVALHLLESRVQTDHAVNNSPAVWACIGYLRSKQHDPTGAAIARKKAIELRESAAPRALSFEDPLPVPAALTFPSPPRRENRSGMQGVQRSAELRQRTEELLRDAGWLAHGGDHLERDMPCRGERLVARSNLLRRRTQILLQGVQESRVLENR